MTTQTHDTQGLTPLSPRGPVVAGVDGSRRSRTAAVWAAAEADDRSLPLRLVAACPLPAGVVAGGLTYPVQEVEDYTRADLNQFCQQLRTAVGDIAVSVTTGGAVGVLLDAVDHERGSLLVVGKRGQGALRRALIGSTSIAVAGRSSVPVVVIPDDWAPTGRTSAPIVAGVEPGKIDSAVLDFAFERAERLRVPLIAATVSHPPRSAVADSADTWQLRGDLALGELLAAWQDRFPTVEVARRVVDETSPAALLDVAAGAQLVVVGRHRRLRPELGFRVGSTARAILHESSCPVAVVPLDDAGR